MKIYILLPFVAGDTVEIKEQDGNIYKGAMTREYSKMFGNQNKYYIDRSSSMSWEATGMKNLHYENSDRCQKAYFYDVFRPCDITRR